MPTMKTLESLELVEVDEKTITTLHQATSAIVSAFLTNVAEPTRTEVESMINGGAEVQVSTKLGDPYAATIELRLPEQGKNVQIGIASGMRQEPPPERKRGGEHKLT
jgi:hypothetical protein